MKALVLAGGYPQIALIEELKSRNIRVLLADYNEEPVAKKFADEYEEKLGFFSCTVPTYIQLVLAELISNGDFERHINRVRRSKRKETFYTK